MTCRIIFDCSPLRRSSPCTANHRQLHDIGRAALDRSIDRIAAPKCRAPPHCPNGYRQHPLAPEERLDVPVFARLVDHTLHVLPDIGVRLEIPVDDLLGFRTRNVQPLGQSERRNAVDDSEIGRFGRRRCSRVTSSLAAWNSRAAVAVWISSPCRTLRSSPGRRSGAPSAAVRPANSRLTAARGRPTTG